MLVIIKSRKGWFLFKILKFKKDFIQRPGLQVYLKMPKIVVLIYAQFEHKTRASTHA